MNGNKVIGPNGNSIFLPAAGDRWYEDIKPGFNGYYWSSELLKNRGDSATKLYFNSGGSGWYNGSNRYGGLSVRAVCP